MKRSLLLLLTILIPTTIFADTLIIEPEMGRKPVLEKIHQAKHTIHLVMYGLTDPVLLDALIKQKQRGRSVKIILEKKPYLALNQNHRAINALKQANMPWHGDAPALGLIHQKTLIIDGKEAIIMTFNFTKSAFKHDRNVGLVIDDPKLVNEIEATFSADWNHLAYTPSNPDLLYSPDNSREKLMRLIQRTRKSMLIYAQSLSDKQIIDALLKRARKGVNIEIITSKQLPSNLFQQLKKAGIKIHLSKHRYIHAKAFIADHSTTLIGSINLTQPSLDDNRELAVISHDQNVAESLSKLFKNDSTY